MENQVVPYQQRQLSILDQSPEDKVKSVTAMANIIKDIILKQKLYTVIQGKNHVRVEGWAAIGSFLGVAPKEKHVEELPDGSYIAEVELVRIDTGMFIGGASAICSVEEKRWGSADKYARRSMAITRATGKAFRLAFAWVAAMAGYEVTPAEEMPEDVQRPDIFKGTPSELAAMSAFLLQKGVPAEKHAEVAAELQGKPKSHIHEVLVKYATSNAQ
jgi:hypothetical protein